ncbi:hypothetical protein BJ912DRAFT_986503 [Pholiota molesta]|nr:hypothetical protein BJ912DRAFT_986503 [Pholiota molesta]
MASLYFRLFLALALVLGLTSHVYAQGGGSSVDASDLPSCAQPCAQTAAAAVNCALTDTACLCAHSEFTSSTESCADSGNTCGVEDRSSVAGVLSAMCSSQTTTTSSSTSTSASTSTTASSTSSQATSTSAAPSSTSSSTTATPAAAPAPSTTLTRATVNTNTLLTTAPTGSTSVVVQTVVLPQTSALDSGALQVGGGVGVYAVLPVVLAMAGGLLL